MFQKVSLTEKLGCEVELDGATATLLGRLSRGEAALARGQPETGVGCCARSLLLLLLPIVISQPTVPSVSLKSASSFGRNLPICIQEASSSPMHFGILSEKRILKELNFLIS